MGILCVKLAIYDYVKWLIYMPRRWQRSRRVGADIPVDAIYVGRPTKWGNPWKIGEAKLTVDDVVALYRIIVQYSDPPMPLHELRGKDLVCWCALDEPCHADVLLELANQ